MNNHIYQNSTLHSWADWERMAWEHGLLIKNPDGTYQEHENGGYVFHPQATLRHLQNFEYDPRHIPLEARRQAVYGVTEVLFLAAQHTQDTQFLESYLFNGNEVVVFLNLANMGNVGTPPRHPGEGSEIWDYPLAGVNEGFGHAMLLIGYDSFRQLFLFKNSWGPNYYPFVWVPYQALKERSNGGFIITGIRDPQLGPVKEDYWLGIWHLYHLDTNKWLGDLIIHNTKNINLPPYPPYDLRPNGVATFFLPPEGLVRVNGEFDSDSLQARLEFRYGSDYELELLLAQDYFASGKLIKKSVFGIGPHEHVYLARSHPLREASWVQGTAVEPEYPHLLTEFHRYGWGSEFLGQPSSTNWFHIPIPTPVIINDVRPNLAKVFVLFEGKSRRGNFGVKSPGATITALHVYDGARRVRYFNGSSLWDDHLEGPDEKNTWLISPSQPIYYGLNLAVQVQFSDPPRPIKFAAAGADFHYPSDLAQLSTLF
jgi:hypothetical protein